MAQRLSLAFTLLLSVVFAFCCSANARKDSGDYWKGVMKDEPIPAALEALILPNPAQKSSTQSLLVKKPNCNHDDVPTSTTSSRNSLTGDHDASGNKDEEAISSLADQKQMSKALNRDDDEESKNSLGEKPAMFNSFEPRPNVSSNHDEPVAESFEPRPNVSAYGD